MNRCAVALVFAALAACSSPTSSGNFVPGPDSGTPATDAATGGGGDSGTTPRTDSGTTPRTDSGTRADGGTTARDAGTPDPFNYGMCGRTVIQALCRCGMNDQNCQQTALQRSMPCVQCMLDFQTACCPMQVQAVQDCFMNSGCMDQMCAQRMCATQINAATTCVNMTLQRQAMAGGGACVDAYLGCLGDLPTMQAAVCASF